MAAFPPQVVQKLVLPFGRLNYLPLEQQFMPCLERILAREAGMAPLATVNILMSLCQLRCLPFRALHFVFSPGFINYISGARPGRLAGTLRAGGLGRAGGGPQPSKPVLLACRHPSCPHCAALPLPAGHGCGVGAPSIPGSPPSPKAASAHLPSATHHRPCPLQVQVGQPGEGKGLA